MSGVLAVAGAAVPGDASCPSLKPLMAALARRGSDRSDLHGFGPCALGTCRFDWEGGAAFSGPVLTATVADGMLAAAVDASLFYRSELRRKLVAKGVPPESDVPAHLVLAAYRAWGPGCVEHLEGNFAFIVWDARRRTLFAARDFEGRKPLFHAMIGDTLVVASSIAAIRAHQACPDDLNVTAIAEDAAFLTGSPTETCYRAISRLPAGWCLEFGLGESAPRVQRFWAPPVFADGGNHDFAKGAEELRSVLAAAVTERLDPERPTTLLMSGGFDSPALFAAGSQALHAEESSRSLRPVSISFPPGDPGREDELIQDVAAHWGSTTTWVDSTRVPAFGDFLSEAGRRDEPLAHPFQEINHAMMRASREMGARVVLDGHGGDYLFQVSTRYFADLFRAGSWLELARDWRRDGGGSLRTFFQEAVIPGLAPGTVSVLARLRGKPIHQRGGFGRQASPWIASDFSERARLRERELEHQPPRGGLGLSGYESSWYLMARASTVLSSTLDGMALEEGVERRSPFLDPRVIQFAARRPRRERRSLGETKRLLRASVGELLPPNHVAPRSRKTGVMTAYLEAGLRKLLADLEPLARSPLLGDLGIVDPHRWQKACRLFRETGSNQLGGRLLWTFYAETWLRARAGTGVGDAARIELHPFLART
jgi:asparagine synthase (glutamine-hydrolysing)